MPRCSLLRHHIVRRMGKEKISNFTISLIYATQNLEWSICCVTCANPKIKASFVQRAHVGRTQRQLYSWDEHYVETRNVSAVTHFSDHFICSLLENSCKMLNLHLPTDALKFGRSRKKPPRIFYFILIYCFKDPR